MAPIELENSDKISIYAEFITSLSVANIFVGFQSVPRHLRVRKVTIERQNVEVTLDQTGSGDGQNCPEPASSRTFRVPLPNYVTLLPNTCSSLQYSPFGWLLRMNIDDIPEKNHIPVQPETEKPHQGPFLVRCWACSNNILHSEASISTVLPLSALGMPSGMDWDLMNLSYFCHDHDHGDRDEDPTEDRVKDTFFVPQSGEVFVGDTSYIISADVLDSSKLKASSDGSTACGRCHYVLGQSSPKGGAVKLYRDAVLGLGPKDADEMLGGFMKDCSREFHRIRALLQDSDDTLLLWMMDRNLKTFQAQVAEDSQHSTQRDVCKILYKQEKLDSPMSFKWARDSNVKQVTVHESLLMSLLAALLDSTESLPMAWRYANDFCIGYLTI